MKSLSKILFFALAICVILILVLCSFLVKETSYFLLIELAIIVVIILFIIIYKKIIKPYQLLTNSMELIKEQDFSIRLRSVSNSEANKLIEIFNKMMDHLRAERLIVREKNHFLDLLIQASPQGLIIFDFDDKVTLVNPTALRLLGIENANLIIGRRLKDVDNPICRRLATLTTETENILRIGGVVQYRCEKSSFQERGFAHPFILIEELTYELLDSEKKSYESIIRLMAHEVNNSISGVLSTMGVVTDIVKEINNEALNDIVPAVEASQERCEHLGQFIKNFADVVKIPEPNKVDTDIYQLLYQISKLTEVECKKRNIRIVMNLDSSDFHSILDPVQFEQVIINILKNAYEAIGTDGTIRIETISDSRQIIIANDGPTLSPEVQQKLFTPFFTTKKDGQGIGLMFIREVLLNHNFKFNFYSKSSWTMFEIEV